MIAAAGLSLSGCAAVKTTGKVIVTPVTVVRDVADAPLVTVTNAFYKWGKRSQRNPKPGAGVGWSWKGGFNFGIGYDISRYAFYTISGIFGSVDYLVCRMLWPPWPQGTCPWMREDQSWGDLYFINTNALWEDGEAETPDVEEDELME
jgi:hypothetical protein